MPRVRQHPLNGIQCRYPHTIRPTPATKRASFLVNCGYEIKFPLERLGGSEGRAEKNASRPQFLDCVGIYAWYGESTTAAQTVNPAGFKKKPSGHVVPFTFPPMLADEEKMARNLLALDAPFESDEDAKQYFAERLGERGPGEAGSGLNVPPESEKYVPKGRMGISKQTGCAAAGDAEKAVLFSPGRPRRPQCSRRRPRTCSSCRSECVWRRWT